MRSIPAHHRRRVACPQAVQYADQKTRRHVLAAGRVEGDDAELKDIYNRYSGSDFDAEAEQQVAALKDMPEPLLGADIDIDQAGLGNLSANRIKQYNKILNGQLREIERESARIEYASGAGNGRRIGLPCGPILTTMIGPDRTRVRLVSCDRLRAAELYWETLLTSVLTLRSRAQATAFKTDKGRQ